MTPDLDHELIAVAAELAATRAQGDVHTMAAAVRNRDGRIATGLNVYHFTGGPCAELVAVGAAAAAGSYDLTTVVAVGSDDRGVMPPCGRCRQVLFDYFPEIEVIVRTGAGAGAGTGTGSGTGSGTGDGTDDLRAVPVRELLPHAYDFADRHV
ncbi:cytidine deaminase [Streptomyces telluris]|uniref:Cytidine deaminase n=1 Tax=Streptomyces telluris TaxID=2720021 RepID=A0A9X2LP46_9ACTN|nr:cytidine deaminase [Streptomyces telluris]MCQ8774564.1 cytidine deaminase [Streptomyces telluris]NJP77773.1 cytidine deaminase [Streptomyces telluris]